MDKIADPILMRFRAELDRAYGDQAGHRLRAEESADISQGESAETIPMADEFVAAVERILAEHP